jgi:hypothetical protein
MAQLGSLQDNQKNSYTIVEDNGTQVAQRVKVVGDVSITESSGTTFQFSGSVDTTAIDIPNVASGDIAQVLISCVAQSASKRLLFSLDGGTTFFTLTPGSMVGWEPKDIEQIKIKGNTASVLYDVLINRRTP